MSKIRGKDTKPELLFRKALYAAGVRYRVHSKSLAGKPDLSNLSKGFAIFIDGEFWHGFDWKNKKDRIKTNRKFWIPKIERNMQRDRQVNKLLTEMGITVFRFWEREVKKDLGRCLKEVLDFLDPEIA